jgi:hypothetical protein
MGIVNIENITDVVTNSLDNSFAIEEWRTSLPSASASISRSL